MKRSLVRLVVGCTSIVLLSVFAGCSSQADNASVNKTITVSTPLSNTPTKTFEVQKVREAIISDIMDINCCGTMNLMKQCLMKVSGTSRLMNQVG